MDLPEGWRIGHTKNVSSQWAEQWHEYAAKASSESDLHNLRFILDDRKLWLCPQTVRAFSALLEDRAKEIGCRISPVKSPMEEKPWHNRVTDFPNGVKPNLSDISRRMTGEAS